MYSKVFFSITQVDLTIDPELKVTGGQCSCVIGLKEACGHVTALLYTIAQYKMLKLTLVSDEVPQRHNLGINREDIQF